MTKPSPDTSDDLAQAQPGFLIVGLGASAGGIEALCEFFSQVPADSGIAYVVILHLSPEHESQLASVLQTVTPLLATQVTETVRVAPNRIYVVSPNQHLAMADGELTVSPNTLPEERRAPVDIFFRTLAETHHNRAVCVVLSGTGADGSMGLKRVKERGGVVFVQSPGEAAFNQMPRNAIATDLVDAVLPVADIPARIMAYQASLGTIAISAEADQRPEEQQQALREIFTQLRVLTGHDFSNYKRPTLLRRIARRINVRSLPDLPSYAAFLRDTPDEVQALLKDLLISVTNFFRDKVAFAALEQEILPRVFQGKRPDEQVRIWVIGCATGEEAYSIAMLCAERVLGAIEAPSVQIFASDIDETALARAREGLYTVNDTADVSAERLRRFFTREDQRYRVRREIREMVLFANHNVLKDPPFSHLDLVSYRNMLIYLNRPAQERVMETLHFALKPGGYLFLGSSESVEGSNDLFSTVSREQHIFQSRSTRTRQLPVLDALPIGRAHPGRLAPLVSEPDERARDRISFGDLHLRLLEQYAPPSLVLDEEYDVVHLSGRAGRYLQIADGALSRNLLGLIRPELRLELRTALYQAVQRQINVQTSQLPIRIDERAETVTIHIRPVLRQGDPARGFLLVVFEPGATPPSDAEPVVHAGELMAQQVESEVQRLKQQLRTSSEQYEFQAEELKATNEELQALNEELRSSTEELETSKEELQSINEELRTVNQELKIKVEEATLHSTNLQNLVNSTDIGTIFLDRSLRVQLFTPAARELFNLIPADHGRPLADITHRLLDVDVLADTEAVLDTLQTIEREVRATNGRVYLLRVLPYRAGEDRIGGVVITFVDITERKRAEEAVRESEMRFRTVTDAVPQVIWANDADGKAIYFNQRWYEYSGLSYEQSVGPGWQAIVHPDDAPASVERWLRALAAGEVFDTEYRLRSADGVYRWFIGRNVPLRDDAGQTVGWFGSATDIENLKQTEAALRESEERFRLLVEGARDYAMFLLGPDNRITFWSSGAERVFGWSQAEAVGQAGTLIFTPEDRERGAVERELRTALDQGRAEDRRWHLRKDGSRLFADGMLARLDDPAGHVRGFVKIARDVTAQRQAEDMLQQAHDQLEQRVQQRTAELAQLNAARRELLQRLVTAQEDERRRIARELHDSLAQFLVAVRLDLTQVQNMAHSPDVQARIAHLLETTSAIDAELDRLTTELRPLVLDDLGLRDAVEHYTQQWSAMSGISVEYLATGLDAARLPIAVEATVYRIVQEALTNVSKHAQARQVNLLVQRHPSTLRLVIADDGVGFDPEAVARNRSGGQQLGLIGMSERASLVGGTMTIESVPGDGTSIYVDIPLGDA